MSAIRLPLLCAFAGGCLSNVVLFGLWRATESSGASSTTQPHRSHHAAELVAAASAAPHVEEASEVAAGSAVEPAHDAASEPARNHPAPDLDSVGPTPAGSAVSDVLTQLEAAYRERIAAHAPAPAAPAQDRTSAAAPADSVLAVAEPARSVPAPPVAQATPGVPLAPPVVTEPPVVAAAAIAPPLVAPPAVAPPVVAAQVAAEPAFAPPDAPPPTQVHYGDVNQNTYITNVRQGDVYLVQMQQIAMLQYMQLLGLSRGSVAPARQVASAQPQRFPSGITNPDNPWGFHFSPLNLVR